MYFLTGADWCMLFVLFYFIAQSTCRDAVKRRRALQFFVRRGFGQTMTKQGQATPSRFAGKVLGVLAMSAGVLVATSAQPASGQTSTSSSSPSHTFISSNELTACDATEETCLANAVCAGCTSAISGSSSRRLQSNGEGDDDDDDDRQVDDDDESGTNVLCSSRYPNILAGSSVSFCERVGTSLCCEYDDNTVAATCLGNALTAEYW